MGKYTKFNSEFWIGARDTGRFCLVGLGYLIGNHNT